MFKKPAAVVFGLALVAAFVTSTTEATITNNQYQTVRRLNSLRTQKDAIILRFQVPDLATQARLHLNASQSETATLANSSAPASPATIGTLKTTGSPLSIPLDHLYNSIYNHSSSGGPSAATSRPPYYRPPTGGSPTEDLDLLDATNASSPFTFKNITDTVSNYFDRVDRFYRSLLATSCRRPLDVTFVLRWGSFPLLSIGNATVPGHFVFDNRTEQYEVTLKTNGSGASLNLTNPLPGDWFGMAYINQVSDRIAQKGLERECFYRLVASLRLETVNETVEVLPTTAAAPPLRQSLAVEAEPAILNNPTPTTEGLNFRFFYAPKINSSHDAVRIVIKHCQFYPANPQGSRGQGLNQYQPQAGTPNSPNVTHCPLAVNVRILGLPSRDKNDVSFSCRPPGGALVTGSGAVDVEGDRCIIDLPFYAPNVWNYLQIVPLIERQLAPSADRGDRRMNWQNQQPPSNSGSGSPTRQTPYYSSASMYDTRTGTIGGPAAAAAAQQWWLGGGVVNFTIQILVGQEAYLYSYFSHEQCAAALLQAGRQQQQQQAESSTQAPGNNPYPNYGKRNEAPVATPPGEASTSATTTTSTTTTRAPLTTSTATITSTTSTTTTRAPPTTSSTTTMTTTTTRASPASTKKPSYSFPIDTLTARQSPPRANLPSSKYSSANPKSPVTSTSTTTTRAPARLMPTRGWVRPSPPTTRRRPQQPQDPEEYEDEETDEDEEDEIDEGEGLYQRYHRKRSASPEPQQGQQTRDRDRQGKQGKGRTGDKKKNRQGKQGQKGNKKNKETHRALAAMADACQFDPAKILANLDDDDLSNQTSFAVANLSRYQHEQPFDFLYLHTDQTEPNLATNLSGLFFEIENDRPTLVNFSIVPQFDIGGTLSITLGIDPATFIHFQNVSVIACLTHNRAPIFTNASGSLALDKLCTAILVTNTTEANLAGGGSATGGEHIPVGIRNNETSPLTVDDNRLQTIYVPYPQPGLWYLSLYVRCYADDDDEARETNEGATNVDYGSTCEHANRTSIYLAIRSAGCGQACQNGGKCVTYLSGGVLTSACACRAGWKGLVCTDGREALPEERLLVNFIFLTASNAAFLPAIVVAMCRRYFAEAVIYLLAMISSTFYHACDADYRGAFCALPVNVLQFADFYTAILAFFVTLITLTTVSVECKAFLHLIGAVAIALATQNDRLSLWTFAIPAGVATIILFLCWCSQCCRHSIRCYPPARCWIFSVCPSLVLTAVGLVIYAFFETQENYAITHSIWHGLMAAALLFAIPSMPSKTGGTGDQGAEDDDDERVAFMPSGSSGSSGVSGTASGNKGHHYHHNHPNAKSAHVEWRPPHTSFKFLHDDIDML